MRFAYGFTLVSAALAACSVVDTTVNEAGVPEASADVIVITPDAQSCAPATVNANQIAWVPPSTPTPSCSSTQIQALYDGCFALHASQAACAAFSADPANAICYACMVSQPDASTYGALIASGGVDNANVAGCIALEQNDEGDASCGAKQQAQIECEIASCLSSCPSVTDLTSFEAYSDCVASADKTSCATYVANVCNLFDAGPDASPSTAYTQCEDHGSFADYYNAMAALFCAAGSDAGDADAADATTD